VDKDLHSSEGPGSPGGGGLGDRPRRNGRVPERHDPDRVRLDRYQSGHSGGPLAGPLWDERSYRITILALSAFVLCLWPLIEIWGWVW